MLGPYSNTIAEQEEWWGEKGEREKDAGEGAAGQQDEIQAQETGQDINPSLSGTGTYLSSPPGSFSLELQCKMTSCLEGTGESKSE